jgi:hypothetical protein
MIPPTLNSIAKIIAEDAADGILMIGNLRTSEARGPHTIVAGNGHDGFWVKQILLEGADDFATLILSLPQFRSGLTINVHEDETEMAEACFALWPCPKSERILRSVKSNRSSKLH